MRQWLRLLGCWIVLIVIAPLAAFAAVTPVSSSVLVETNALTGEGTDDPHSDSSTGARVTAASNVFVATANSAGAYATQTIAKGRRFGGNGTADAGSNEPGRSAFGRGKVSATFTITDLTYAYTVVGNLGLTLSKAGSGDTASFRLTSLTTGQVITERALAISGSQTLGAAGELPPGTYKIELEWNITSDGADGLSTSNFFQIDMSNPDEPPPPPDDDEEDDDGTTMLWANSAGGAFAVAGNWNPATVPGEDDIAAFKLITSYTVDIGTAHTLRVYVENGNATFINANYLLDGTSFDFPSLFVDDGRLTLDGGNLTGGHALVGKTDVSVLEVKNAGNLILSGSLRIGGTEQGHMKISDGGKVTSGEGRVGGDAHGGVITLSGVGSKWTSGNLAVGFAGPGDITVDEGAVLDSGSVTLGLGAGSSGIVTIEGDPEDTDQPRWNVGALTIGGAGTGTLEVLTLGEVVVSGETIINGDVLITDGAAIDHSSQRVRIGVSTNAEVVIKGFDPATLGARMIQINELTLGDGAAGGLTLQDGGLVSCATARTGISNEGDALVTGEGDGPSHWAVAGQLTIGEAHISFVEIKAGGKVTANNLIAGKNASGRAVITVSSNTAFASSLLATTGSIVLGLEGQAELRIEEDSLVTSEGGALGVLTGSIGRAVLGVPGASGDPAEWIVNGDLTLGGIGRGEVVVQNGATVTVDETLFILNNGFIGGTGSFSANFVQNGGNVTPGSSPGILTITGDYEQTADGTLTMEIGGSTPGVNQDQLVINGDATLGGKLVLKFIDDFVPAQGDQILLLNVRGATTGAFANIEVTGLEPGFEHSITTNENGDLVITALNDGVPLSYKGMFRGLLSGAPPAHTAAGFFTVRSNGRGTFSANFVLGGATFAARGTFDSNGNFTKVITRADGSTFTLNLELAVVAGARVIRGTIVDGATTIDIFAERGDGFHAKKAPAPQEGKYTAVLPFDPVTSAAPQANGFALASVTKGAVVTLRGTLADGQRLAHSTVLSKSGGWPVYVPLYAKKGALFGQLQFRSEDGSDFDGTLQWTRPNLAKKQGQLAAFVAPLATIGSLYVAPPTRPAILALPNGATATLADAGPLFTKNLTLSAQNRFVVTDPGTDKFALSAAAGSGILSARFVHPSSGRTTTVKGVLFQKGNFASGFFLHGGVSGSFELQAKP